MFYEPFGMKVVVEGDVNLGEMQVKAKEEVLKEVVVEGKKNPIQNTEKGVIIDVAGSKLANKGDVSSVINYVPSVSTSEGIKIFGSDDIVLIVDGKEVNISKGKMVTYINSIPLKTIESIEVVDKMNAGAEGTKNGAIMINTIKKDGLVGSIMQNIHYNKRLGETTSVSLFYTRGKVRVFGDFYFSGHKSLIDSEEETWISSNGGYMRKESGIELDRRELITTAGLDWNINEKNSLSFLCVFMRDGDKNFDKKGYTDVFRNGVDYYKIMNRLRMDKESKDNMFSVNYTSKIDDRGSEFRVMADYDRLRYDEEGLYGNKILKGGVEKEENNKQNAWTGSNVAVVNAGVDKKLEGGDGYEVGVRYSHIENNDGFEYLNMVGREYLRDEVFLNDFSSREQVYALYGGYDFRFSKERSLNFGGRVERNYNKFYNKEGDYENANTNFLYNLRYNSKLWGKRVYVFAQNRLRRVSFSSFNTTYVQGSPTDAYVGNKELKPVNIYKFMTGYKLPKLSIDVLYEHRNNIISSVRKEVNGILVSRPENIGVSNKWGMYLSSPIKVTDWWESNYKLSGGYLSYKAREEKFSSGFGEFELEQTFYLPKDIEVSLNYSYNSGSRYLYMYDYYNNSIDMSVYYPINDKCNLRLSVRDIFDMDRSKSDYEFEGIKRYSYWKSNSRGVFLTFTYDFYKGKEVDTEIRGTDIDEEKGRVGK